MTTAAPARTDALHLLGTDISDVTTAHGALVASGIAGMGIRKVPIQTAEGHTIDGQYALADASGQPLPRITVGEDFRVVQFEDNADVLDAVARRTGATFDSAGVLDTRAYGAGGARAYVALSLPEKLMIGDDPLDAYIVAFMNHGNASNFFVPTATRVACANQQPQVTRNSINKIVIRHTPSALQRTALAEETLVTTIEALRTMAIEAEEMLTQAVTDAKFREIVDNIYPLSSDAKAAHTKHGKLVDTIEDIFHGKTMQSVGGTAWGAYQAIIEYDQWYRSVRGEIHDGISRMQARRTLTSDNATQIKAFETVRELVGLS